MRLFLLVVLSTVLFQSPTYGQNLALDYETPEGSAEKANVARAAGAATLYYTKHRLTIDFGDTTFVSKSYPTIGDIVYAGWKSGAKFPTLIMIMSSGNVFHAEFKPSSYKKYQINARLEKIAKRRTFESFGKIAGDDLYALSYETTYISRDSSKTWQENEAGLSNVNERFDLSLDSAQNVWLGTGDGLFKQPLISNMWTAVASAGPDRVTQVFVDRLDRIWIKSDSWLKVSLDGGATFVDAPSGLPPGGFIRFGEDVYQNLYAVTGLAPSLEGGSRVYKSAGGTGPFQRLDASISQLFTHASQTPYLSISGDSTVWLGTVAGAFKSTDQGMTWIYAPRHAADEIQSFIPGSSSGVIATNTGIFKRTEAHYWQKVYPATGFQSGMLLLSDPGGSMQYLIGKKLGQNTTTSPYFEIHRSIDFGSTWTIDTAGGSEVGMSQLYADGNGALHAIGHVDMAGVGPVIRAWKKPFGGQWSLNMTGLPLDLDFRFALQTISGGDAQTFFAYQNTSELRSIIYRQQVGSGTWENYANFNNGSVLSFAGKSSVYTVATSAGIGVLNAGIQMLPLPENVKPAEVSYSMAVPSESGRIWAWFEIFDEVLNVARGSGIYYTDNQSTWTKAVSNLDTIQMSQLVSSGDSLFVITQTRGVFVVKVGSSGRVERSPIDQELRISPNPATGSIHLSIGTIGGRNCALSISDATGRVVERRTIDLSSLTGDDIDIRDLSTGTYMIEVFDGEKSYTAKLLKE